MPTTRMTRNVPAAPATATARPGARAGNGVDLTSLEAMTLSMSPSVVRVLVANHARFLAFLERRVRSRDVAEEILQDAFVRGIARGGSLREDESAVAWFYRLLRNALIDHQRGQSAEQRGLAALSREVAVGADGEPDQELIDMICGCVTSLVETLKPEYAGAIERVDLAGESLQGYATEVGITRGNAAVRLFRARQALRRRIEQSCGTCATHGCYQCQCRAEPHAPPTSPQ
jgi:RNA polymerase sigma factor (sigma-70 family)